MFKVLTAALLGFVVMSGTWIACKECRRSFDKEAHRGYCPFCGANNN